MNIVRLLLVFLIIFNFPVPLFYNSAMLAVACTTVFYLIKGKLNLSYFLMPFVYRILLGLLVLIFLSVTPALFHLTFDFSITKAFVLQFFLLCCLVYCLPILIDPSRLSTGQAFNFTSSLLVGIFALQSIVEILAFAIPAVANFVHLFQKENVGQMDMGGIRALALAGNPFFDLSSGYAICFIVYVKLIVDTQKKSVNLKTIFFFLLLIIGTFFAGRTGFVGLALALLTTFLYIKPLPFKMTSVLKILLVIPILIALIILMLPASVQDLVYNKLLPFAFEFVFNYIEQGSFSTDSTDVLSDMYFPISLGTFLLGDGKYMNSNGSYYMYTDAGYMRHILYAGIMGQIVMLLYQSLYFLSPLKLVRREPFKSRYNSTIFWISTIVIILVLHYKGEVIGFLAIAQLMIMLLGVSYIKDKTHPLK